MVADFRDKMEFFFMGISDLMVNECRSAMLIPSMIIFHLMVHAEQIEEQKLKQFGSELKKVRTKEGNSPKIRFEVQDNPWFERKFSNQGPSHLQGSIRVRCLLRITKRRKVVILMLRNIFVQNVVENMMVSS